MKNVKNVTYPQMGGIHDEGKGRNVLKTQEEIHEEYVKNVTYPQIRKRIKQRING